MNHPREEGGGGGVEKNGHLSAIFDETFFVRKKSFNNCPFCPPPLSLFHLERFYKSALRIDQK